MLFLHSPGIVAAAVSLLVIIGVVIFIANEHKE